MNKKIFKYFITAIILIFLIAYFIEYTGYYEYSLHNKKVLTEEQISIIAVIKYLNIFLFI